MLAPGLQVLNRSLCVNLVHVAAYGTHPPAAKELLRDRFIFVIIGKCDSH